MVRLHDGYTEILHTGGWFVLTAVISVKVGLVTQRRDMSPVEGPLSDSGSGEGTMLEISCCEPLHDPSSAAEKTLISSLSDCPVHFAGTLALLVW